MNKQYTYSLIVEGIINEELVCRMADMFKDVPPEITVTIVSKEVRSNG